MSYIAFWPLLLMCYFPGMGCNECTHPSCQHSLNSYGIGQCVECESGVLVLDPTSGPKWRMACNKCNVVVHFFEHAHRVQVRNSPTDFFPVCLHNCKVGLDQTWSTFLPLITSLSLIVGSPAHPIQPKFGVLYSEGRGSCSASVYHSACWHSWFPQ